MPADDDLARVRLVVSGRVQGVFFRQSALDEARRLGLSGWVRNLPTGEVEIVAEGRRPNLRALALWSHRGPRGARVSGVAEEWEDFRNEFDGFRVR